MICCATKAKDDLFEVEFNKVSLGSPLAPCQDNDKIWIIYDIHSVYSNGFNNDNVIMHILLILIISLFIAMKFDERNKGEEFEKIVMRCGQTGCDGTCWHQENKNIGSYSEYIYPIEGYKEAGGITRATYLSMDYIKDRTARLKEQVNKLKYKV